MATHVTAGPIADLDQLLVALAELPPDTAYYIAVDHGRSRFIVWHSRTEECPWTYAVTDVDGPAPRPASGFTSPAALCVAMGWYHIEPDMPWRPLAMAGSTVIGEEV